VAFYWKSINHERSHPLSEHEKIRYDTGWISTSKAYERALIFAESGIAIINLDRAPEWQVFDTTKWYNKLLLTKKAKGSAELNLEVLVWLYIPPAAILSANPVD